MGNDVALRAGPREQLPKLHGYASGCVPEDSGTHIRTGCPQLADAYDIGWGVNASPPGEFGEQLPRLSCGKRTEDTHYPGQGVHAYQHVHGTCAARRAWLLDWFGRLRDRLRNVRVCCGSWERVCSSESVTTRLGTTGVFLDPPYPRQQRGRKKSRAGNLYASDSAAKSPETIRDEVLAWCQQYGPNPQMRIVVAGYENDGYEALGWREEAWKAGGGYGNRTEEGKANARRERLWVSPHCHQEKTLFDFVQEP